MIEDLIGIFTANKICLPIYYSLNDWKDMIGNLNYLIYVMEENKIIYGYILAEKRDERYHILSFGVLPELRRKNIGTSLMNKLFEKISEDKTIKKISLNVHVKNTNAISFYIKNGFQTNNILKNYYWGTEFSDVKDAFHMIKNLL